MVRHDSNITSIAQNLVRVRVIYISRSTCRTDENNIIDIMDTLFGPLHRCWNNNNLSLLVIDISTTNCILATEVLYSYSTEQSTVITTLFC